MTGDMDDPDRRRNRFVEVIHNYRRYLFFGGLIWFAVVLSGGIYLSTIDARVGLHVFGSEVWVSGEESALRVGLRDLKLNMNQDLETVEVQFVSTGGQAGPIRELSDSSGGFVQGHVRAPNQPGSYTLRLTAIHEGVPLTASVGVRVLARPSPSQFSFVHLPAKRPAGDDGPIKLNIRPLHGVIPSGLSGELLLSAFNANGDPAPGPVNLGLFEGKSSPPLPEHVEINEGGFTVLPVHSVHPQFKFQLSAGESGAFRSIRPEPTQFSLQLPSPVLSESTLEFAVSSLHRSGPFFVDIWHGEHWLRTTSGQLREGEARVKVTLPSNDREGSLLWLQVYRHAYMPGKARAGRFFIYHPLGLSAGQDWFSSKIAAHSKRRVASLLATFGHASAGATWAQLGYLNRPEHSPPLLADSGQTIVETVSELKATWQRRFAVALTLTGILMFLVIGVLLVRNQREVEAGWQASGAGDDGQPGTRRSLVLDAGYLFLVLAVFMAGMVQLLLAIHW